MIHQARKRFGQNFLQDTNVINSIIGSAMLNETQHWVEIGAGQGALTKRLIDKVKFLDVVELDRDLVAFLQRQFSAHVNWQLHSADALQFDFSQLARENQKLRIIGNLPYNISTPLMFHLLSHAYCIQDMLFMLQKEVVDRLCALPDSKSYGRLSVMMQYYCKTEWLFDVPPESFQPVPRVMSAMVRLIPYEIPQVTITNVAVFERVVADAFSQRRKTLRNALKKILPEYVFTDLNIDGDRRAETITLSEFAQLSNAIHALH